MGMFLGSSCPICWDRNCNCTAEELERYEFKLNNRVYPPPPKKAIFRGIDLVVGDRITNDYRTGNSYLVNDFQDDGRPIVTLISNEKHEFYNKPYPHEELLIFKPICYEYK